MTPAEHYAEAERLIDKVEDALMTPNVDWIRANSITALAAVHARLANVDDTTSERMPGYTEITDLGQPDGIRTFAPTGKTIYR